MRTCTPARRRTSQWCRAACAAAAGLPAPRAAKAAGHQRRRPRRRQQRQAAAPLASPPPRATHGASNSGSCPAPTHARDFGCVRVRPVRAVACAALPPFSPSAGPPLLPRQGVGGIWSAGTEHTQAPTTARAQAHARRLRPPTAPRLTPDGRAPAGHGARPRLRLGARPPAAAPPRRRLSGRRRPPRHGRSHRRTCSWC